MPAVLVLVIMFAVAGAMYFVNANKVPTSTPDLTDPKVAGQAATTDMYSDALISAFNCVQNYPESSCDKDDVKSKLIIAANQEILNVNGKPYPVPDKTTLKEVLASPPFAGMDWTNMNTEQRGKQVETIDYTNDAGQAISFTFGEDENGEKIVTQMTIKDK